jgi:hypothetical protein
MGKPNGLQERARNFITRNEKPTVPKHAGIGTPVEPFILIVDKGEGEVEISTDRVTPLTAAHMLHAASGVMLNSINKYLVQESDKIAEVIAAMNLPAEEGEPNPAPVQQFNTH